MKTNFGMRSVLLVALTVLVGCNDQPMASGPVGLVLVQAPSGAGAPGFVMADTLKVRSVDPDGVPRSGIPVAWSIRQGGGRLAPISDTTDTNGIAEAVWTLGARPGPNSARAATIDEATVDFNVSGEAFRVQRLASDWRMGCGLVDGALWCWGVYFWANTAPASRHPGFDWGGIHYGYGGEDLSPGLVDDTHVFVDLAVGYATNGGDVVCATDRQSAVWCAGRDAPQMAQVAGLPPIRGLVGAPFGARQFCGLAVGDSTAWCWLQAGAPAQVPASPAFVRLWMGGSQVCGLLVDSTAACWGTGPLGDGTNASSPVPVAVSGGHRFIELGVGRYFSCGRTPSGDVWCRGRAVDFPNPALDPVLTTAGATLLGVDDDWGMMIGLTTDVSRWAAAGVSPDSLSGLSGLPVDRFALNGFSCLQLVGGEVYCNEEMFNRSTGLYYGSYVPVQPVRSAPGSAADR